MNTLTRIAVAMLVAWPLLKTNTAHADGNITVTLENGVLYVLGDKQANNIILIERPDIQTGEPGYFFVGGSDPLYEFRYRQYGIPQHWFTTSPTTVNGGRDPVILYPAEMSQITDIVFITGGGDDYLFLTGIFAGSESGTNVWIDCGAGRDRVVSDGNARHSEITGDLHINSGHDDDEIWLNTGLRVAGDTEIFTGHGNDSLYLGVESELLGDVVINMGAHDDALMVFGDYGNIVGGNCAVEMGQGNDTVLFAAWTILGSAQFEGGQGNDSIQDSSYLTGNPLLIVGFESN